MCFYLTIAFLNTRFSILGFSIVDELFSNKTSYPELLNSSESQYWYFYCRWIILIWGLSTANIDVCDSFDLMTQHLT